MSDKSMQPPLGVHAHASHSLTLLNKYIISTRFAMKFLTWEKQLSAEMFWFQTQKSLNQVITLN